jgi:hypothetical protein
MINTKLRGSFFINIKEPLQVTLYIENDLWQQICFWSDFTENLVRSEHWGVLCLHLCKGVEGFLTLPPIRGAFLMTGYFCEVPLFTEHHSAWMGLLQTPRWLWESNGSHFFTQWKVNPCAFFAVRDVMCLMFRHLIFCFLCLYHLGLFLCAIDYVVFDHFFFLKILKTCQYSNICQWFVSIIATFNHPNRHFFYCIKDI